MLPRHAFFARISMLVGTACLTCVLAGCGDDDDDGTQADRLGVAAECGATDDCPEVERDDGEKIQLQCLSQFKGGYCGIPDCVTAEDCPQGSTCVAHTDGSNYCFRDCANKSECNRNRSADVEANCSSNFDFASADDDQGQKACIPPSA